MGLPQCGSDNVSSVLGRCGAEGMADKQISQAQQDLLSSLGSSWDSPLELEDRCLQSRQSITFENTLFKLFSERHSEIYNFACIPGMERVLPLWQNAITKSHNEYHHLLVIRHPLAVVEQFKTSFGWNQDHALLVWLQSNLSMEFYSKNKSRVILDIEHMLWDLDSSLDLIEGKLQLSLPERNHKALLNIENTLKEARLVPTEFSKQSNSGSLLLSMALQLYDWLICESTNQKRLSMLPHTIRQQLNLAEKIMGRTLSDLSFQNANLNCKVYQINKRRSIRFANWIRTKINISV